MHEQIQWLSLVVRIGSKFILALYHLAEIYIEKCLAKKCTIFKFNWLSLNNNYKEFFYNCRWQASVKIYFMVTRKKWRKNTEVNDKNNPFCDNS